MIKPLRLTELPPLRRQVAAWKAAGERVALVPTMGALHAGHLSLVRLAKSHADRVVASIFVNPAQFGPNEDLARYPRTEETDLALLAGEGVDAVYLPDPASIYPSGFATSVRVTGLTESLCGASRPGHFDGVALVVAKLFNRVQPDVAVFGEKDWQQLQVVLRLAADLDFPVEIIGAPIVREADGLALSSRNRYLSEAERRIAPALHRTLLRVADEVAAGRDVGEARRRGTTTLEAEGFRVDYLEVVDAQTLCPRPTRPARLLAAAWLGTTRLLDNVAIP